MVREVKLYGALAKFVGQRRFLAEINSAGEAVRMLLANFPGLEQHMADQHYKVIVDNYESELEEINNPASQRIQIVPVLGGAGSGTGKILAGVALIATAILIGPAAGGFLGLGAGLGGATGAGAAISMGLVGGAFATAVGAVGVALVLGGVSQLISPTPQLGTLGPLGGVGGSGRRQTSTEGTEFDPQESYSFSGIQNTSKQGVPVPVVYGETIVGSVVISAGIDVDTI
jgi:predicted phage tail protein